MAATAPSPPLAVGKGMIDIDAHRAAPFGSRGERGACMLAP
jgi:hypothetical protein